VILRRKQMPPELRADWQVFQAQTERVEQARQALLGCLPVGRADPGPVPVALELLQDELTAVAAELDRWKRPEVAGAWERCAAAIDETLAAIPKAKALAATTTEMEKLLVVVMNVLDPLEVWGDAERAWLRLRTR
jgi:hypothetical protein